jgi:hypothetical protein
VEEQSRLRIKVFVPTPSGLLNYVYWSLGIVALKGVTDL